MLAAWLGAEPATLVKLSVESARVPSGFHVEVLTDAMPAAREMTLSSAGILYVGNRTGKVYAMSLQTPSVSIHVVAPGLQLSVGVAWRNGNLYVSVVSRVPRVDGVDNRLGNPPDPTIVSDKLPTETHHGRRFTAFGLDGKLCAPVGTLYNICHLDESRYVNLTRMNAGRGKPELVVHGIRNMVGFDQHPSTYGLWLASNSRDLMGDDVPDDELNRIAKPNLHFGYPSCHAGDIPDPGSDAGHLCSDYTPSATKLGTHVATLGMRFYTGSNFPPECRSNIFIMEHNSWNRSSKVGYRVVRVVLGAADNVTEQEPFIQGWL